MWRHTMRLRAHSTGDMASRRWRGCRPSTSLRALLLLRRHMQCHTHAQMLNCMVHESTMHGCTDMAVCAIPGRLVSDGMIMNAAVGACALKYTQARFCMQEAAHASDVHFIQIRKATYM